MKAVVLHGAAISQSRKKLIDLKQNFDPNNVVTFEEGAAVFDILETLQTVPMFGEERLIIAENPPEDLTDHPFISSSSTLILWFDHEIDPKKWLTGRSKLPAEILFFPENREVSVFPFLDLLAYQNKNAYLEIDKLKKAGLDTQYFITMIFYLLRSLTYLPAKSTEFVKKKIAKQKINFSQEKIIFLYKFILETDFKIKKGLMEPSHGEFLIISSFFNFFQH